MSADKRKDVKATHSEWWMYFGDSDGEGSHLFPLRPHKPPVSKLPISAEAFRRVTDLFARKLDHRAQNNNLTDATRRYKKMTTAGQLSFTFTNLDTTPSIGPPARRFLLALWELTARTNGGEWYEGTATARELLDTIGKYDPCGEDYRQIERFFKTLRTMHVEYDNKRRGVERVRWEFNSPVIWRGTLGEGVKAQYIWALNPASVSPITASWLLGEFDLDTATHKEFSERAKEAGGIVIYPTKHTRERLPADLDNARLALLTHNWRNTPSAYKILTAWLCVKPSQLEKPTESIKLVFDTLDELEKRNLIGEYTPPRPAVLPKYVKRDLRRLKFKLERPVATALGLTPEQHDKYIDILEWIESDKHHTKTTKEKRREQLHRAYKNYPPDHIGRVYHEHERSNDISGFWEALFPKSRRRKRKKKPQTETAGGTDAPKPSNLDLIIAALKEYKAKHNLGVYFGTWGDKHHDAVVEHLKAMYPQFALMNDNTLLDKLKGIDSKRFE